jgi:hypothetical protein
MRTAFVRAGIATAVLASAVVAAGALAARQSEPAQPAPAPAQSPVPAQTSDWSAQSPAPAQSPVPASSPAAQSPAAPPIELSTSVTDAAAAYEAYVRQASALTPAFVDGESIQASLRQGEAYEPKSLARDTVAFAAVVALEEPTFVQGVRTYAIDPAQRADMIRRIEADPGYAAAFPGAQAAANRIAAKLSADGEAIAKAGYAIKQSAYTIQHKKWSKEFVRDPDGRLAVAKQLSETSGAASSEESAALMRAAMTGQGVDVPVAAPPQPLQTPYTTGVNRALAIAALATLGAAGDENVSNYIQPLMDENVGQPCLKLAKLNLFQCLAVAKPHYEDVFCLGEHALMETGECVVKTAGVTPENLNPAPKLVEAKATRHGKHTVAHKHHKTTAA